MNAQNAHLRTQALGAYALRVAFTALLCPSIAGGQHFSESPEPYKIVLHATISALPSAISDAYKDRIEQIEQTVLDARRLAPRSRDVTTTSRTLDPAKASAAEAHYVLLDMGTGILPVEEGQRAARRFPHEREEAMRVARLLGVKHPGTLPWTLVDLYAELVEEFRDGRISESTESIGRLIHFATDSGNPGHLTVGTGNLVQATVPTCQHSPNEQSARTTPAKACDAFERLVCGEYDRLAYEVRVHPSRTAMLDDPLEAVFEVLLDSHRTGGRISDKALDQLTSANAQTLGKESHPGVDTRLNDEATIGLVESQLERSAWLAASLIRSAWQQAGRPPLLSDARQDVLRTERSHVGSAWVGSKHSTIFHRWSCPHSRRIKPSNVVEFSTTENALQAGRKPCKTCRPQR